MRTLVSRARYWLPALAVVTALAVAIPFACSGPPAPKGEKPAGKATMFGGSPSRNFVNTTDKNVPVEWDIKTGTNVKWSAKLGTSSYGGPVVSGGKVFVGTNNGNPRNPKVVGDKGVLMCFDAASGKFLWQAAHDKLAKPFEFSDVGMVGISSAPAVEGNRLYYVSNRCELICADTETGKPAWTLDMIGKLGVIPNQASSCAPLLVGDLVYVCTSNGTDEEGKVPAPKAPSFIAVDKKTGNVKWQDNSPGANIMEGQWSNPTYAEVNGMGQVICPAGDGWLYALDAQTGKLVWKFDCNPKSAVFKGPRGDKSYFVATPVVYDNKCYSGVGINPEDGTGLGHLWCIDITKKPGNKDLDLSPVKDNFDPKAPENKDSGLVWHVGGEIKPRPKTGREYHFGRTISSCAVADGLCYAVEFDGFLNCFDAKTGQKYWEYDLKTSCWSSPYVVDGKVYLGTDNKEVLIFKHGKETPPKNVPAMEMGRSVKGAVTVVDGVLYVQTDNMLYAIGKK